MNMREDTTLRTRKDYLAKIHDRSGFPCEAVLASPGLSADANSSCLRDDNEAVLTWRPKWRWQKISRVTGVVKATDREARREEAA